MCLPLALQRKNTEKCFEEYYTSKKRINAKKGALWRPHLSDLKL